MKKKVVTAIKVLGLLGALTAGLAAPAQSVYGQDASEVIAVVNGEEIYREELLDSLAARHQNMTADTRTAWVGFEGALDRLIDTKLILQEARDIGLDQRPEISESVEALREKLLVSMVKKRALEGLRPDEADIEKFYADSVRVWSYKALFFEDLEKAREFRKEVVNADDYETVGQRYVDDGFADWDGEERQARESEITPEIRDAFTGQDVGSVTPVIIAMNRHFVFKLTGVTYLEDAAARDEAESAARELKKEKVLDQYLESLIDKYVTVDSEVLDTVGKDPFPDMAADTRIIAELDGEAPVRVSDLIDYLKGKFYHGEKASQYNKTLRAGPRKVLREALEERLFIREARELGLDETDQYVRAVTEYENSLVFGFYLEKFLAPQARVPEEEIEAAWEDRSEEFLMPQRVEVDSLTFAEEDGARKAMERLRRGADMKWISENAQGLETEGITREELVVETLPEDLQRQLAGVKAGDTGFYNTGENLYKVYSVIEVPPRRVRPYQQVRSQIGRELFGERLQKAVEDLAAELRGLSEITVYEDKLDQGLFVKDQPDH